MATYSRTIKDSHKTGKITLKDARTAARAVMRRNGAAQSWHARHAHQRKSGDSKRRA